MATAGQGEESRGDDGGGGGSIWLDPLHGTMALGGPF